MLKTFKAAFVMLTLAVLVGICFFGCSSGKSDLMDMEKMDMYTKNGGYSFVYVLTEGDFNSLKKDIESGKDIIKSFEKYTPVTDLTVGEQYYAVGYTVAQNNSKTPIEFHKDSGFYFYDQKESGIPYMVSSGGYISVNKTDVSVEQADLSNTAFYSVMLPEGYNSRKAEICPYISFSPRGDMRIEISYGVSATRVSDSFGDGYVCNVTVDAHYDKRVDLLDMSVSYLESDEYVNGTYDEADLKSSIDMERSKTYYMVIRGKLKPSFDQNSGEVATLKVNFPLSSRVNATIYSASSGTYDEYTYSNEDKKEISVDFKLPEVAGEEKEFELVVRLIPQSQADVYVDVAFFSPDGISVVGKDRVVEVIFKVK